MATQAVELRPGLDALASESESRATVSLRVGPLTEGSLRHRRTARRGPIFGHDGPREQHHHDTIADFD